MSSTKQMQERAKQRKLDQRAKQCGYKTTKGQVVQGQDTFTLDSFNIGHSQFAMFTAVQEAKKLLNLVRKDALPYSTKSTVEDLTNCPFNKTDAGFLVVIAPYKKMPNGLGVSLLEDEGKAVEFVTNNLSKNIVALDDKQGYLSTYCTWDKAQEIYAKAVEYVDVTVVGFSTPKHLHILAENIDNRNI